MSQAAGGLQTAVSASSGQECFELPSGHQHLGAKITLSGQYIEQQEGGRVVRMAPNNQESAGQLGGHRVYSWRTLTQNCDFFLRISQMKWPKSEDKH